MCVIAYQQPGAEVSGNKFRRCWDKNSDGGGLSYIEEGKVVISKGYFDMKEMLGEYRKQRELHPDSPFILHFRIATHGAINEENTHPFYVRDDLVLAHNGILSNFGSDELSDTRDYIDSVLKNLPNGWEDNEALVWLVENSLGYSNKFCLLRADGEAIILNESAGEWVDDVWYSNSSWKKYKKYGKNTHSLVPAKTVGKLEETKHWFDIDEQYAEYEDELCAYCDHTLDYYDAEWCAEIAAVVPVCEQCVWTHRETLENEGTIAMLEDDWGQGYIRPATDNPKDISLAEEYRKSVYYKDFWE
jgi:glutamine amidotransferase